MSKFFKLSQNFSVWRAYGLKEPPPPLTNQQKDKLITKYVEQGVFNEPLSLAETWQYQVTMPSNSTWFKKYTPHIWSHKYRGIENPIPIDDMINPLTKEKFKPKAIRVSHTILNPLKHFLNS